ncbi:hypothetical protein M0R45_007371 [Rubus argutus]|uniref:KRR-R motif-containing protein 1 n=1 Tax=Rubus argutus TaxID=59490 RepID=A0AAW1XYV5_RUBAR
MEIDKSGPSSSFSNETSFSGFFHEKQENKLKDIWPMIESCLEEIGIACALNLAERSMRVSTTTRTKGRNYFVKATRIVELLTTTHVPPHLAVEILRGGRRHILIKIGNQEGGLCSKYGINKEQFVKQRESLACSLEALAALTCCNLFLNENTLAAVGEAIPLSLVREIVTDCIVKDVNPADSVRKAKKYLSEKHAEHHGMDNLEQPNVDYVGMDKSGPSLDVSGMPEITSFSTSFLIGREKEVQEAWPSVQSFIEEYGISCTLRMGGAERSLTISTTRRTKDPDIMDKAGEFLEMLATTSIPASKAIEILNGRLQHDIIKTGFQDGGLGSKFEMEWGRFENNKERFKRYLKALSRLSKCDVYINESSVVAVGTSAVGLRRFRSIVECCFVKNEDPETIVRRLKLNRKTHRLMKKLEALCV